LRRRCLILMPRPLPAAPLAVRSFNAAWQAALGQYAPSPLAFRHTYSSGRAAGGPRRGSVPQAQGGPRHHCEG
jgi:integrase